jgi:hypothetical protein
MPPTQMSGMYLTKFGKLISEVCSSKARIIKEVGFVGNHAKLSECREIYILAFLIVIPSRNKRHESREREMH